MDKVLFIGHFAEASGWGRAARDYILAMDSVGIDVVPRRLRLGAPLAEIPQRILDLEKKSSSEANICIQHVLPHHLVAGPFDKNICIYATETDNFSHSGWQNYINLMDEAWVICKDSRIASTKSGVDIPIKIVPHACDPQKYKKKYKKLWEYERYIGLNSPEFLFYFIGEYVQRKNIPALLRAFHTEFDPSEPVNLLLKVNSGVFGPEELCKQIQALCSQVKKDLRLYSDEADYKRELIITDFMSEEEIMALHNTAHSFVNPSYGEAWSYPTMDAFAMGKRPICTYTGGMADYLSGVPLQSCLVGCNKTAVAGVRDTFDGLFTGHERWDSIDINDLRFCMRSSYVNRNILKPSWSEIDNRINEYSYESIGHQIKGLLGIG